MDVERGWRTALPLRLWHWLTALCFVLLVVTGVVLHGFAPVGAGSYALAVTLHEVCGYALSALLAGYVAFMFHGGGWRSYVPERDGLLRRLRRQGRRYFGVGGAAARVHALAGQRRFNVLQQLSYAVVVFALLPLLVLTGLIYLYYPQLLPLEMFGLPAVLPVALLHFALGVCAAAFLVLHVFMALFGGRARERFRLMVRGRC
ncbi:MAG TPA: cytochrome b/b6 domain-containing protein [Nevskiaceae bacterium]